MKEYKLEEILDSLIGHVCSYGDTNFDEISKNNLKTLEDVSDYIMNKLTTNCYYIDSHEGSRVEIAEKSYSIVEEIMNQCKYIEGMVLSFQNKKH